MASELPIVTQTQGYAVSDWAAAKEQGRKEGCAEAADLITELTEALREVESKAIEQALNKHSGEAHDVFSDIFDIARAALAKTGGTINE